MNSVKKNINALTKSFIHCLLNAMCFLLASNNFMIILPKQPLPKTDDNLQPIAGNSNSYFNLLSKFITF